MTTMADLATPNMPTWCPGCGNFPLWLSFKNACISQDWNNSNTTLVAGIGCHGHLVNFTKMTAIEGLHGRPLPVACGIKIANPSLNVFVFTGDGDCFGEGGNHFIHTARRNHNLTVILHDNGLYALTTGQTSPLTQHDIKTKSSPNGNPDFPLNPLVMAISSGATFVARSYASDVKHLEKMIIEANKHQGFSIIDVLQPCVTYNTILTHQFYQENTYYLPDDYNPNNKIEALRKAFEFGEKSIPLGIFYKEDKTPFEKEFKHLKEIDLIKIPVENRSLEKTYEKYY